MRALFNVAFITGVGIVAVNLGLSEHTVPVVFTGLLVALGLVVSRELSPRRLDEDAETRLARLEDDLQANQQWADHRIAALRTELHQSETDNEFSVGKFVTRLERVESAVSFLSAGRG